MMLNLKFLISIILLEYNWWKICYKYGKIMIKYKEEDYLLNVFFKKFGLFCVYVWGWFYLLICLMVFIVYF